MIVNRFVLFPCTLITTGFRLTVFTVVLILSIFLVTTPKTEISVYYPTSDIVMMAPTVPTSISQQNSLKSELDYCDIF